MHECTVHGIKVKSFGLKKKKEKEKDETRFASKRGRKRSTQTDTKYQPTVYVRQLTQIHDVCTPYHLCNSAFTCSDKNSTTLGTIFECKYKCTTKKKRVYSHISKMRL